MSESMFTPLNTSIPAGQPNTQRTADKVVVVPVNCMHSGDRPCNPGKQVVYHYFDVCLLFDSLILD